MPSNPRAEERPLPSAGVDEQPKAESADADAAGVVGPEQPQGERGGPKGPEPTRFGDWEKNGRCFDF